MRQVTVARSLGYEIEQQEGALAEVVEHARYCQYSAKLTAMTSKAAELFWRRGIGAVALFRQIKVSPRFGELTMQCPHCAHPDYICYSTSRGVQRYRCQACWRIFKSLRRGKESSPQAKVLSALSSLSRRDGVASYWQILQADTSASIIRRSLACWCKPPKHSHGIRSSTCRLWAMARTCCRPTKISFQTPSIT